VDETFEYGFIDVSTSLFAVRQQQNKTQKKRNIETTKHTHIQSHTCTQTPKERRTLIKYKKTADMFPEHFKWEGRGKEQEPHKCATKYNDDT